MFAGDLSKEGFQAKSGVDGETLAQYEEWFTLLSRWNSRINLVASSTLNGFWQRHALDSHQVYDCLPVGARSILDLGAGAGFPGIALAILLNKQEGALVTLVESNGKKSNFLRTVIRELSLPAKVLQQRVEEVPVENYDVVTARAFAPLPKLLTYAHPFWGEHTQGVFPKGESWETEVEQAQTDWSFELSTKQSVTDELARIVIIKGLHTKANEHQGNK